MPKYMYGVSKLEMGAIAGDGGMGTVLADVGDLYQDTVELIQDDPETTEHRSETKDDPILVITRKGKTTVKFSIVDMTPSNATKFLGGTTGVVSTTFDTLKMPDTQPSIEQSLKFTTLDGGYIQIPRAKLVGKINAKFSRANMLMIDVTATVLQPTKTGEGSLLFATPKP